MKDLIKAGKELNDLLFDDDEINVKGTKEEMEAQIVEAAELIDPTKDVISDETKAVLEGLDVWPDEKGDEGEKEGEDEPGDNLVDQINDAPTMKGLKIIAKDLDEFKSLRGILTKYKTKDDLREVMLEMLEDEGKEPEPEPKKELAAKKTPAAKTTGKRSAAADRVKFLTPLIKQRKLTKVELTDMAEEEFPDVTRSTLQTMLTDAKNPKYNKFDKLVVQDEKGVMSFKK